MLRRRLRALSGITLAGYLLALAGAALWHDHGDHVHAVGEPHVDSAAAVGHHGRCSCHRHACVQLTETGHAARDGAEQLDIHDHGDGSHSAPGPAQDEDNCSVCRFLAVKPLPVTAAVAIEPAGVVALSEPGESSAASPPALPLPPPRGPPSRA